MSLVLPSSHEQKTAVEKAAVEKAIGRNPHRDFGAVERTRPAWSVLPNPDVSALSPVDDTLRYSKTKKPDWKFGGGANDEDEAAARKPKKHRAIDPYGFGRMSQSNYKLLISAIVPRPIGLCSTVSLDGKSSNLAPFSYFNLINHDPPLFIFGFAGGFDKAKDTLRNLTDSKQCCINIISEHFIEAANACSMNAPHGLSEWTISGLHPIPCSTIAPHRVQEAIFSIECLLVETREYESKSKPGEKSGVLAIVEGVNFWVREDAVNDAGDYIDPAILRPISRLGRITYGRTMEAFELPRPDWSESQEMADWIAANPGPRHPDELVEPMTTTEPWTQSSKTDD